MAKDKVSIHDSASDTDAAVNSSGRLEVAVEEATQLDIDNLNATDDIVTVTGGTGQTADVKVTLDSEAVTETNSAAIKTAVELIDDAISGSEILIAGGATQTNDVKVSLDSEAVVLGAGSAAVGKLAANDGVDIGDVTVNNADGDSAVASQGQVAHDAANAGNPVVTGAEAIAHGTNPTAVAAADSTKVYANRAGIPFVIGGHPNILTKNLNVTDADGAQTDTAIVTIAASNKIVVTWIAVTADNANTVDVQCRVGFGTTNTPAADAAGVILAHPGIAAGSGVVIGNGGGILGVGADNEDLRVTCEDPVTGSLDITVGYYTIES